MKNSLFIVVLGALLMAFPAAAAVEQTGNVTYGHAVMWNSNGIIQDAGVSTLGYLNTLGITANGGTPFCISNTTNHAGDYYQFCMGVNSTAAKLTVNSFGTGGDTPLVFSVNGTDYEFPFGPGSLAPIANNTVIGNVSGSTAAPTALTTTQLTTLCNVFTSSLKGCAPASSGSTTDFLRADGQWVSPGGSGSPGGSTTQVQYNNSGSFDGDSGFTYNGSGTATLSTQMTVGSSTLTSSALTTTTVNAGTSSLSASVLSVGGASSLSTTQLTIGTSSLTGSLLTVAGGATLSTNTLTLGSTVLNTSTLTVATGNVTTDNIGTANISTGAFIGSNLPTGILLAVGNQSTNNSTNPGILLTRAITGASSENYHGYSDSSTVNLASGQAYNSYDCRGSYTGSNNTDHYACLQAAWNNNGTGTITDVFGVYTTGTNLTTGTITNGYGVYVDGYSPGFGTLTNNYGVYVDDLSSSSGTPEHEVAFYQAGTGDQNQFNGCLLMGAAPTGGCKGTGTINVSADLYKNNTAYTNPDYVFEKWATGKIVKFAHKDGAKTYKGLQPLGAVRREIERTYALPRLTEARKAGKGSVGLFGGGDALLASLEEAYLYLFNHEDRITLLEREVRTLAAQNAALNRKVDLLVKQQAALKR